MRRSWSRSCTVAAIRAGGRAAHEGSPRCRLTTACSRRPSQSSNLHAQICRLSGARLMLAVRRHAEMLSPASKSSRRVGRAAFAVAMVSLLAAAVVIFEYARSSPFVRGIAVGVILLGSMFLITWRCRDFGRSPFDTFWRDQIPIVGLVWALYELVTRPGIPNEENRK
jgi:hypothetical protein